MVKQTHENPWKLVPHQQLYFHSTLWWFEYYAFYISFYIQYIFTFVIWRSMWVWSLMYMFTFFLCLCSNKNINMLWCKLATQVYYLVCDVITGSMMCLIWYAVEKTIWVLGRCFFIKIFIFTMITYLFFTNI